MRFGLLPGAVERCFNSYYKRIAMKKIFIVGLLAIATGRVSAQTEQGRFLMAGSMRLRVLQQSDDISLSPSFGYFFFNNFAAGTALDYAYSRTGQSASLRRVTTIGAGPFVRYYFGHTLLRPFVHGDVNVTHRKDEIGTEHPTTANSASYFVGPGVAVFLHRHTALEGFAGYEHIANAHRLGGGFELRIGFRFI